MNDISIQDSALAQDLIEEVVTNPNIFVKWWNSIAWEEIVGLFISKRHYLAFFAAHLFCFKTFIQLRFAPYFRKTNIDQTYYSEIVPPPSIK